MLSNKIFFSAFFIALCFFTSALSYSDVTNKVDKSEASASPTNATVAVTADSIDTIDEVTNEDTGLVSTGAVEEVSVVEKSLEAKLAEELSSEEGNVLKRITETVEDHTGIPLEDSKAAKKSKAAMEKVEEEKDNSLTFVYENNDGSIHILSPDLIEAVMNHDTFIAHSYDRLSYDLFRGRPWIVVDHNPWYDSEKHEFLAVKKSLEEIPENVRTKLNAENSNLLDKILTGKLTTKDTDELTKMGLGDYAVQIMEENQQKSFGSKQGLNERLVENFQQGGLDGFLSNLPIVGSYHENNGRVTKVIHLGEVILVTLITKRVLRLFKNKKAADAVDETTETLKKLVTNKLGGLYKGLGLSTKTILGAYAAREGIVGFGSWQDNQGVKSTTYSLARQRILKNTRVSEEIQKRFNNKFTDKLIDELVKMRSLRKMVNGLCYEFTQVMSEKRTETGFDKTPTKKSSILPDMQLATVDECVEELLTHLTFKVEKGVSFEKALSDAMEKIDPEKDIKKGSQPKS